MGASPGLQGRWAGSDLTGVLGDIGLYQFTAGRKRWLGLAEVLDGLGLGYGGQHGARALRHAGVREQLRRGAPIGVPHLVAQLRVEAGIAVEERGASVDPAYWPRARSATRLQNGVTAVPAVRGSWGLNGQHRPSTENRAGPREGSSVITTIGGPLHPAIFQQQGS